MTPHLYRFASRAMFAPFGGMAAMRKRTLHASKLKASDSVLELGCGPGDFTAQMCEKGGRVLAVDVSQRMLDVATRRAPGAQFECADIRSYNPGATYDLIVMSFVLHEVTADDIPAIIQRSAAALNPEGHLAVLDHSSPNGIGGMFWRMILRAIESRAVDGWLAQDVPKLMREAGLRMGSQHSLAGGRARLFVGRR